MAPSIRAIGFCGADDSVHPHQLAILCHSYPLVEFGVLFRPDKEGQPRYATTEWVQKLGVVTSKLQMKLAAHLCGSRVNDVLAGDDRFVVSLVAWGFRRVQINATAVNGVDTSKLRESVQSFLSVVERHPEVEFIIQKNDETNPLWQPIIELGVPSNISMLVDESKGTGVAASSWPEPPLEFDVGYAGGIGPRNVRKVMREISEVAGERTIWIDMESSLRSVKDGLDVFDLDKCYRVVQALCEEGFLSHPDYLR